MKSKSDFVGQISLFDCFQDDQIFQSQLHGNDLTDQDNDNMAADTTSAAIVDRLETKEKMDTAKKTISTGSRRCYLVLLWRLQWKQGRKGICDHGYNKQRVYGTDAGAGLHSEKNGAYHEKRRYCMGEKPGRSRKD